MIFDEFLYIFFVNLFFNLFVRVVFGIDFIIVNFIIFNCFSVMFLGLFIIFDKFDFFFRIYIVNVY